MSHCKRQLIKGNFSYWKPSKNTIAVILNRSGRSLMFFKRSVLKNFTHLTLKHLCCSLFLLKRDSNKGVTKLRLAKFLRTPLVSPSVSLNIIKFPSGFFLRIDVDTEQVAARKGISSTKMHTRQTTNFLSTSVLETNE